MTSGDKVQASTITGHWPLILERPTRHITNHYRLNIGPMDGQQRDHHQS